MTKPKMWNNFCNKKTNVAIIFIGMWALSALLTLPSFLEVRGLDITVIILYQYLCYRKKITYMCVCVRMYI